MSNRTDKISGGRRRGLGYGHHLCSEQDEASHVHTLWIHGCTVRMYLYVRYIQMSLICYIAHILYIRKY